MDKSLKFYFIHVVLVIACSSKLFLIHQCGAISALKNFKIKS